MKVTEHESFLSVYLKVKKRINDMTRHIKLSTVKHLLATAIFFENIYFIGMENGKTFPVDLTL